MTMLTGTARRRMIGDYLRQRREALGYSLEDMARFLECHPSKMSRPIPIGLLESITGFTRTT